MFPDQLDADGFPEGWKSGQLQEIAELNPNEAIKRGAAAPYLDMAALPTSGPTPDSAIPREFTSGTRFRNGDTLFARITPCLENGKTAFIQSLPENAIGWGSTEFVVLRSSPPVPPAYSYLVARNSSFRAHAIQSMTGTSGRQRARSEALASYPVAQPSDMAVWSAFGSMIEPLFERIRLNGEDIHTLAQTRDLLLPKLMSGAIRVRGAEKLVETAA
jgi:type I restriction enzyme S subunit